MDEAETPARVPAKPIISVIVPVHDTEPYIDECLGSLVAQTLRDIEIVCVDDGSTDASAAKLAEWQEKDPRIRVLRQGNRGGGAARNTGMDAAQGAFLFFCDSDDACEPEMLEEMHRAAENGRADVVVSPRALWDSRLEKLVSVTPLPDALTSAGAPFSGSSLGGDVFTVSGNTAWNKLFSRSFVESNGIRNAETPDSGDLPFVNLSMALARRIAVSGRALYKYRFGRPGSAVASVDKSPLNLFRCFDFLRDGLVSRNRFDEFAAAFAKALFVSVGYQMSGFRSAESVVLAHAKLRETLLGLRPRVDLPAAGVLDGVQAEICRTLFENPDPVPFLLSCWRGAVQRGNALRVRNAVLAEKWRAEGRLRQETRSRWEADVVNLRSRWSADAARLKSNWEAESRGRKGERQAFHAERARWLETLRDLEGKISALEAEVAKASAAQREAEMRLDGASAAAKAQKLRFERSMSWRITAPLRAVRGFAVRLLNRRKR